MTIIKTVDGSTMTLAIEGRLDTNTTPQLEVEQKDLTADIAELVLDFSQLEYISSAGLRVILGFQKKMNKQGEMRIRNAAPVIMEVFEVTGFASILTIE